MPSSAAGGATSGECASRTRNAPSGTPDRNIEYKAYGSGAAPVISGATAATGWTVESASVYHTNIGSGRPVKNVFVGDEAQTLARTPNKDASVRTVWNLTENMKGKGDGTTFIRDSALPAPGANNLVGATAF